MRRKREKAECRRIDAFELWCWRGFLRVSWTAWRSKQSILKKISPEYSLEGLMLKLKLHYFGHKMGREDSLEKIPMLGKIEGGRRRGQQDEMVGWHHKVWIFVMDREAWGAAVQGIGKSHAGLSD